MRTAWIVFDRVWPILALVGISGFALALASSLSGVRQRTISMRNAVVAVCIRLAIGVSCALATLFAWHHLPPPGRGMVAEDGFRRARPVIEALDRYRSEHGRYPAALLSLVPRYITADALAAPEWSVGPTFYHYRATSPGYALGFDYHAGIKVGTCTYEPDGEWLCPDYW